MTALSVVLPDDLARESREIARQLGFSRTEFIRRAIAHELKHVKKRLEQQGMVKSFEAMKASPEYLKQVESFDALNTQLPEDEDEWWNKKSS
jgi:predicted transcriptional regulator